MIKFNCLFCGQRISAEVEQYGTTVACPGCSGPLTVPAEKPALEEERFVIHGNVTPQTEPTREQPATEAPNIEVLPNVQPCARTSSENDHKLWGLCGAMLAMPFFMFTIASLIIQLWDFIGLRLNYWVAKAALPVFVILFCISLRSLQCIYWLKSDPFRAAAVGKNLFLIFLILATLTTLIGEFPKATIEAPLDAVYHRPSYNGLNSGTDLVIKRSEVTFYEPTFLWWIGYFFDVALQLVEHLAIYSYVVLLYHSLKGSRPDFEWEHFCYEISFEKYGQAYPWDSLYTHGARESGPSKMEEVSYYYVGPNNEPIGPISRTALFQFRQSGVITDQTMVAREGGAEWRPMSTHLKDQPLN